MFGDWFNSKDVADMGIKLANDLSQELVKINNPSKRKTANTTKVIQKVFSQLDLFKQKTQLNFFKKSKLINEFRWRLTEAGYDEEFVRIVTKELVLYIN